MKTIVDRRKWLRGPYALSKCGQATSYLLDVHGMKCCLGFRLDQDGVPSEALVGGRTPGHVYNNSSFSKETWLVDIADDGVFDSSGEAHKAMEANDNQSLTDEEREEIIKNIFEKNGEEIEFVGPRLPIVNGIEVRYEEVENENNS